MKILHVYNKHRGGGGADDATDATIRILRDGGVHVDTFSRHSGDLPDNALGRASAFLNGVYARAALRDFADVLRTSRPDVVHAHELYPLISPWILSRCAHAGIPVVCTCYDFRLTCPIATHYCRGSICHKCSGGRSQWVVLRNCRDDVLESAAYGIRSLVADRLQLFQRHVCSFVVLSRFCADWLQQEVQIPAERITVIPCGLPMPTEPVPDPDSGAYVAYAGRLAPEKGVGLLVDAARRAEVPLRLAASAATTSPSQTPNGATLVLTRSKAELAEFYRGARMLVVPSTWYETFSLVTAEAMSHGIPAIVSRIGALQEWVEGEDCGLHFEPGSVDDLARQIARLWSDPDACRAMGAAARRRAIERCSEPAHFSRHRDLYERVAR